ncbi:MAG: recombination mediator RecR [Treponemataceae bacterium]|nr:MAG: recombination mediator RecR [Treponemataceae bacterium]
MNAIDEITDSFSRFPGIGKKSAHRIAHFLLKADTAFVQRLSAQLASFQDKIKTCSICGAYTEEDPCPICTSPVREKNVICVVANPEDVAAIDGSHEFSGLFHVLGGLIAPLDGITPDKLSIDALRVRIQNGGIDEVILATNPTVEGDTTALYIEKVLRETGVRLTRLASGLPVGGDLEYADKLTLARSFRSRMPV